MKTATELMQRPDLRYARAMALAHRVQHAIRSVIDDREGDRFVMETLIELFMSEGVEVLTDCDRQTYGLPPRGPDGWTNEEIFALEQSRLAILLRPFTTIVTAHKADR